MRELRLRHAHGIGPVLRELVAHIRRRQGPRDVFRYFIDDAGRGASRHPYSIQIGWLKPGRPASEMVGTSGSRDERFSVLLLLAVSILATREFAAQFPAEIEDETYLIHLRHFTSVGRYQHGETLAIWMDIEVAPICPVVNSHI
jgi:hypothetical protein